MMPPVRPSAESGLLIIDMINEFMFDGAAQLFPAIEETARHIAALKRRMKEARLPVVYVNDNFGKWQSDFRKLVARCLEQQCRGNKIARILLPEDDDYFILKPKHSGFYATPLELLLRYLKVGRVIVTGIAADNCVLFTAADAYMREFGVAVPSDCVVSLSQKSNQSHAGHIEGRCPVLQEASPRAGCVAISCGRMKRKLTASAFTYTLKRKYTMSAS